MATPTPDLSPKEKAISLNVHGQILFFFAVLIGLFIAWHLLREIEILYVSGLFAVILMPIVNRITDLEIRGRRPSRPVAIVLLFLFVILSLTLFFLFAVPPVLRDLRNFLADLPRQAPTILAKLKRLPYAGKLDLDSLADRAQGEIGATASYLFSSLPNWLSHLFDLLTGAFLTIYFMLEGEEVYRFFLSMLRPDRRRRLDQTLKKAELKVSKWLLGQGLLMLILGVASTVVFGLLHVRYFILLGVLMGLLNLIPIAGGLITILLTAAVAAIDSWSKMAGVLIFYAVYINIENAILIPRIMRSSVNLMGITVLVSLLLGTALAGIVGALVCVPTAALIAVLLDEYAVQRDVKEPAQRYLG